MIDIEAIVEYTYKENPANKHKLFLDGNCADKAGFECKKLHTLRLISETHTHLTKLAKEVINH